MARQKRIRNVAPVDTSKIDALFNTPEGTWRASRLLLAEVFWTFAPAIRSLIPKFIDGKVATAAGLSTMGVDKYYRCYINNQFTEYMVQLAGAISSTQPCPVCGAVEHSKLSYVAGVIGHEAQHPLREHAQRAETAYADRFMWNVAADFEINDDLLEMFRLVYEEGVRKASGNVAIRPRLCLPYFPKLVAIENGNPRVDKSAATVWTTTKPVAFTTAELLPAVDLEWIQEHRVFLLEDSLKQKFTAQFDGYNLTVDLGDDLNPQVKTLRPGQTFKLGNYTILFTHSTIMLPKQYRTPSYAPFKVDFPDDNITEFYYTQLSVLKDLLEPIHEKYTGPFFTPGGQGDCGSGAHGYESDYEEGEPTEENPGISEAEGKHIQRDVAKEIKKASATRGTVPAGMERWADTVLTPPKVDWRKMLKSYIRFSMQRSYGHEQRSWRRLGRSSAVTGYKFLYPSTYQPVPKIGVVLDTSGSMGYGEDSPLYDAYCEVQGLCKQLGAGLTFVSVDAEAGEVQHITNFKQACITGGGGTDMRVGVEALEKSREQLDVIIVLTDGETPWPDHPPGRMTLIAALCGNPSEHTINAVPEFIKMVIVEPKEKTE